MSYSIESLSADCYPETHCLINKFDIHDESVLSEIEAAITAGKIALLEQDPIKGAFDFAHYKSIHKFIFEDIYEWAGKIRTVNMAKKNTRFVDVSEIETVAANAFHRLTIMNNFVGLQFDEYIYQLVDFYCVLNMLHPFREGNGRTERVFISQLVALNGYSLDFSLIDVDELMIFTIQASSGIKDNLISLFYEAIRKKY